MSSVFWQTMKQTELLSNGKTLTEKINKYIKTWKDRCYSDGIPDEVPEKLSKTLRAPSYKAIAIAILKNDHTCKSLGFNTTMSQTYYDVKNSTEEKIQEEMKF